MTIPKNEPDESEIAQQAAEGLTRAHQKARAAGLELVYVRGDELIRSKPGQPDEVIKKVIGRVRVTKSKERP